MRLDVTLNQNHRIIFNLTSSKNLNKYEIFKYNQIQKFSNNIDLRKVDFLSAY